ncbi:hypothetical protein GHT06_017502 [Daphnia sinensis]|uniref:Uncharacterized protein n=1 Tax=Daphnia sinensis TaxID=1820382 RepID=A0AAD5LHA4_9CRUS|nr:hypothetical protein GHT06_017502 [Daphnia sinensis]
MLMSLNSYRDQAVLRNRKRSLVFQWLTAIFLFVNLVACLTLISVICNQNELLKATNKEGVYFAPTINTVCKSMCNLRNFKQRYASDL